MKASELIRRLQELISLRGDLVVETDNGIVDNVYSCTEDPACFLIEEIERDWDSDEEDDDDWMDEQHGE